jgi:hypothetical protein
MQFLPITLAGAIIYFLVSVVLGLITLIIFVCFRKEEFKSREDILDKDLKI